MPDSEEMPMSLQVNGLGFSIHNKKILDQIFLELKPGEFVGLIGPNGCGKSTLLKHIYRTYRPQRGMVFLDGKDLTTFSSREMAAQVAVMAQENPLEFDFEVADIEHVRQERPRQRVVHTSVRLPHG